jgi:hypothetical protein
MLRLARQEENVAGRRRLFFILLVIVPIVSTFHAICFFLDYILFPGLRKVDVRTPVFIVGHAEGFMALRWTYSEKPDELPTVKVTKVSFDEIRNHLPAGMRTVSAEERREQIRIRQGHVQRRYRQN